MTASRVANSRRSGSGASSFSQSLWGAADRSTALAAMLDLDYCARPQPHDLRRRVFEPDPHREPLRHAYPIERAFYVGNRTRHIDLILIENAPANAVHDAA